MFTGSKQRHALQLAAVGLLFLVGTASIAHAQDSARDAPVVMAGAMPLYPVEARSARIQGTVILKATTDGSGVKSIETVSGPPMLARYAAESVRTWKFFHGEATTFLTQFVYQIDEPAQCVYTNGHVVLNLPSEVHLNVDG
jgi:outer membrane biosynthesis protein TonB